MPFLTTIDYFSYGSVVYSINYSHTTESFTIFPDMLPEDTVITEADRGKSESQYINTLSYPGETVDFYASLTYPFATLVINPDGSGDPGDGDTCDLTITNISITNQSVTSAHDGSVTISAATTHTPIQYSIDNLSWQSSNVFTGLNAGHGIAYVKDAMDCTASMGYDIITTPIPFNRLVSTPASGQSRWSALFNPIVFGYQSESMVPGRKFITQITSGYDGATNIITATHAANLTGYCRADISKYLRTLLQPKDELDYTAINYRDANISASYTVQYKEAWNGGEDLTWTNTGDPFYVTYSAMQIGNKTGGNMGPYVTYPDAVQTNPAKFLNDFKYPVFYTDMPWDLSFIYSEKVAGYQLKLGGNGIDINGNIAGALGETMLLNEDGSVLLNEDGSKLLIEKQAPGVLYNKLGVNRLRISQNLPANSIWLDVFLFYTDGSGNNIRVTENRRLLLDNSPCNGLPYEYLKWVGPTGGWLYYLFTKNQLHELNTSNPVLMERYISDYAAADSSHDLISISAQRKITAGKNDIPAHEAEALATILYSPKVYRLVDADTNTWQGVIIDTKSIKMYQTYGNTGDFEISYLLPEVNTQRA
ncbi:MAG: hypothetical protein ABIN91_06770 [Mucilaginibacter sp.]|uniref:hypothetical protein n=1 Tax=Mucilaginibacter sp. TaxID=1882438 RepID=UPI0032644383